MPDAPPLAVRFGAFGDMVILTALIRELHARFGQPVDVLTSGPWSEPLLAGQPGVGTVFTVRSRKTPWWLAPDQRRIVARLTARGFGPVWLCDANARELPMIRRLRVPRDCIVDVNDYPLLPGEHATAQWERLAWLTPPAGINMPGRTTSSLLGANARPRLAPTVHGCELVVSDAQRADVASWLERRGLARSPLILIQIGNKRTMRRGLRRLAINHKYWPLERWASVLNYLRARHPQAALLLLGTGPEFELNQELLALAPAARALNVADELPIPRLIALLARAQGLVTVDSGPAHAAAAVGCPQVTLFGRASVALYRPTGVSGADVRVVCGRVDGVPDMLGIGVAQVTEAWAALRLRG